MAPANDNNDVATDPKYKMVEHVIDTRFLEELSLRERSIYKVPHNLREVNNEAYTPQFISIGPIHFGKQELHPMQEHKKRYFHFFWERVSNEQAMENYKRYLESKEQEIRKCYAEKFPDMKEKFVETVLLDAVFIMELLLRNTWESSKHSDDYILTQPWLSKNIARDLVLLENQIPFFVLEELYDTVVPKDNKKKPDDTEEKKEHATFLDLALEYLTLYDTQTHRSSSDSNKCYYLCGSPGGHSNKKNAPSDKSMSNKDTSNDPKYFTDETKLVLDKNQSKNYYYLKKAPYDKSMSNEDMSNVPKHFTDLKRFFYLPADLGESGCSDHNVLRTATKLQESGVSFEKVVERRLLDITFEKKRFLSYFLCLGCSQYLNHFKARLRIPQLKVDHTTECVLRNLIALEQCHYPEQPYICNYVSLVDSLIHTQVDVELLVERKVIVHELGSNKEVAALVNGLCKHVVVNSTCYNETINELNNHYQNIWNRSMAALNLVYFRDPWRASGTVVGIAVLIFTAFNFIRISKLLF